MAEDEVRDEEGDRADGPRAALEAEHLRVVGLRRAVSGDALDDPDPTVQGPAAAERNPADPATEVEDRERDQAILEQLDQELRDVDDALGRLDRGEYGVCEVCGEPIGEARLEALPATRFCLRHQSLVERRARHTAVPGGDTGPVSLR